MALASSLMADIGNIIGKETEAKRYAETSTFLRDNYLLDSMHWSKEHNAYLDIYRVRHSNRAAQVVPTSPAV